MKREEKKSATKRSRHIVIMKDWFRDQFMHVAPNRTNENGTYFTKEI